MTEEPQIGTTDVQQGIRIPHKQEPGVAFTEPQYDRIQQKIVRNVSSATASLWLAACLLFVGCAIGGVITYLSLPDTPGNEDAVARGQVIVACVACAVVAAVCLAGHIAWYRQQRRVGHEICDDMDTHSGRERASWRKRQLPRWQRPWQWLTAWQRDADMAEPRRE